MSLHLPAPVTSESCRPSFDCNSHLITNGPYTGSDYVAYFTNAFKPLPGGGPLWYSATNFVVAAPVFGWNENGLVAEAQLPAVQLLTYYSHQSLGNPDTVVSYSLSGTAYDWAGGPSPSYVLRPPVLPSRATVWQLPVQQLLNPIPVGGTDSSTATWDSLRTFVSGALLGIAGGALVGAIQVALDSKLPNEPKPS